MMNFKKMLITAAITSLSVAAPAQQVYKDSILAKVNGQIITRFDVSELTFFEEMRLRRIYPANNEEQAQILMGKLEELRKNAYQRLIDNTLILSRFRELETEIPREMIEERMQQLIQQNADGDLVKYHADMEKRGYTMEDVRKKVHDMLVVELMRRENVDRKIVVTPQDISFYYNENKEAYATEGGIHLKMLVITKPGHADLAKKALEEAAKGSTYEELLKKYGDASQSADLGLQPAADLRPEFVKAAATMKDGDFKAALNEEAYTVLLNLETRLDAGVKPLEKVYQQINRTLREEQFNKLYKTFIDDLKKSASVVEFVAEDKKAKPAVQKTQEKPSK